MGTTGLGKGLTGENGKGLKCGEKKPQSRGVVPSRRGGNFVPTFKSTGGPGGEGEKWKKKGAKKGKQKKKPEKF